MTVTERENHVKEIVFKHLKTLQNTEGTYDVIYKDVTEWYRLNSSRSYYAAKIKILINLFYDDYLKAY